MMIRRYYNKLNLASSLQESNQLDKSFGGDVDDIAVAELIDPSSYLMLSEEESVRGHHSFNH